MKWINTIGTDRNQIKLKLEFLLFVTLLNYLAQIPYYWHNYFIPYHTAPSMSGVGLLGFTLVWFLLGYVLFQKQMRHGYIILLSFLLFEAVFYAHTLLTGAIIPQLHNPSTLIRIVFIIGYISGLTAAFYSYLLLAFKRSGS